MDAALLLVLLAGLVFALLLATRNLRHPERRGQGQSRRAEAVWERKLLSMTLGNRGAIERGLTAKRRQHPGASRAELLRRLHDDYVRDRSR
ncbi:hypothetical protein [Deinococcus multiflagellatus]|uniref:hypothetical protein n=1 Tax=Deinococcus multiflagellatus TaxID=1656887 RepID=UPI001CCD6E17|nr:hypothetical protein [Deinococcus multiflagellatus]MBZ9714192.1 hypothetical protein [Deinococcus multiflagellatus]